MVPLKYLWRHVLAEVFPLPNWTIQTMIFIFLRWVVHHRPPKPKTVVIEPANVHGVKKETGKEIGIGKETEIGKEIGTETRTKTEIGIGIETETETETGTTVATKAKQTKRTPLEEERIATMLPKQTTRKL
jgi:hypothetical protein